MERQEQESFLKGKAEKFGFNHIFVVGNEGIGFYFDENTIADHREEPFYYDIMEHDTFITEPFIIEDGIITKITVIVVNMWIGIPYTMLMCSGILMNIPADLYESARIDGAGHIKILFRIVLPLSKAIIAVMVLYYASTEKRTKK